MDIFYCLIFKFVKMKKFVYTITITHIYEDGKIQSFLERICDNYDTAKQLLNSLYDEAFNEFEGRHCKYSDPKWLDDNTLQVTSTIRCGGIVCKTTEVYSIHSEMEANIYSRKEWIAE